MPMRTGFACSLTAPLPTLPTDFNSDLGLQSAHYGGAKTTFHFQNVPILKLGVFPNGVAPWSSKVDFGDTEYIVTFDVPPALLNDLAVAVGFSPGALRLGRTL
jgi:hypothetical protein